MVRNWKSRLTLLITIRLDAGEITVAVVRTVLDREVGYWHVPIRYPFRGSTTIVGEWVSSQAVLWKDATQPIYVYDRVGGDVG
jgi:hypothetical protein